MRWVAAAETAERLLGDSEGICVVDDWLADDDPEGRFFMLRRQGRAGELVRRVWGEDSRFFLPEKRLDAWAGSLKKVLFELEDHPEPDTPLDGTHIGVFMRWQGEQRVHQVFSPEGPGDEVIGRILGASRLRLRLRCVLGDL